MCLCTCLHDEDTAEFQLWLLMPSSHAALLHSCCALAMPPAFPGTMSVQNRHSVARHSSETHFCACPQEKEIARMVCLAFGQKVCGFDLLRSERGKSYVCDVNRLLSSPGRASAVSLSMHRRCRATQAAWVCFPAAMTSPVPCSPPAMMTKCALWHL